MLIGYKRGQGSIILRVKILNSSVATGAGLTGLTNASSGLIVSTIADNEATATAYTVAGSNVETITTLGTFAAPTSGKCRFKEVDATNHKGVYEIQIADARYAVSNAKSLLVSISGATNAAETDVVIPLRDLDPYDSVRAGLTALPNAAAAASGGLIINGSNSGTVTLAAVTVSGALTVSDGVIISATTASRAGLSITGAASGNAVTLTAGSSAYGLAMTGAHGISITTTTGAGLLISATSEAFNLSSSGAAAVSLAGNAAGLEITSAASDAVSMVGAAGFAGLSVRRMVLTGGTGNTTGLSITGNGTGAAVTITGGATGNGITLLGGATSGHGLSAAGQGASSHGVLVTGGTSGTSDGMKLVAGTGGVPLRGDITGNITGNLSGSIGSLGATAKSDVNAEVLDVINTDTYAEPGQGTPSATLSLAAKINYLFKAWRNKSTQTSTEYKLYADDTTTVDQKATASDDGTTFTRGEVATGP